MDVPVPFYDKLLPLLGFDLGNKISARIEESTMARMRSLRVITQPWCGMSRAIRFSTSALFFSLSTGNLYLRIER